MRNRVAGAAAIAGLLVMALALHVTPSAHSAPVQTAQAPKLVVLIVVDQMRADYVDRFRTTWTGGLKRLVTQGAHFTNAAYPYLNTYTCAGHATISTGALPRTHGIVQNVWWDRAAGVQATCTADAGAKVVGYSETLTKVADSAIRLEVPTLADVMRTERGARVVTVSLKADSAIMLAGHGGDAVTWMPINGDAWLTSSAYAAAPNPVVASFIAEHPVDRDFGKTWRRLLPAAAYPQPDKGEAEAPPAGWTSVFPHVLTGIGKGRDLTFRTQWQRSPYADAFLGELAAKLVSSMHLGSRDVPDVLGISFSSPDLVGHGFGPASQELQDIYLHLDRTIGTLLDRLDVLVGKDQYTVALTADHGVTPLPEQRLRAGKDGGRISAAALAEFIDKQAQRVLGGGPYVARITGSDIFFESGMYEKLKATPAAMTAVIGALRSVRGIGAVYPAELVRSGESSGDPMLRAAALSYFPGRSGDIMISLDAGWMFLAAGTTHGTGHADDQRVPIVLFGNGIQPGSYTQPATPADIAPTLASLYGLTLSKADGRVLGAALSSHGRAAGSARRD